MTDINPSEAPADAEAQEMIPINMADFVKAYISCILFTDADSAMPDDLSVELQEKIADDCTEFLSRAYYLIDLAIEDEHFEYSYEQAGHDFWLTRNGHGSGFWDRNLDVIGAELTTMANDAGPCEIYIGDDGKIHC